MSNDGLFTDGTDQFAPKVNSIPLSDVDTSSSETSVGQLVSNATEQMSQLVRSEVELAKTELAQQTDRVRPAQYKQPSRKGKKSWRKNIDLSAT